MAREYLNIELTEEEKEKANEWMKSLLDAETILKQPLPITFTKDMARGFYRDVCQSLADGKVLEHTWRSEISKKYNVDYAVGYDDGNLFLESQNDDYDDEWKI